MDEYEIELAELKQLGLKDNPLRLAYENEVRALRGMPETIESEGCSEEQIARIMHRKRRELGRQYKDAAPPLFREYIFAATAAKYGDPLGPTYEMLRERKTDREIIDSASRPIENLDDRLTLDGFQRWFSASRSDKG